MKNYYVILGVRQNADKQDIKKAYRDIAKKYHPDSVCASADEGDEFVEATEAYETLADDSKRDAYDRNLRQQQLNTRSFRPRSRYDRRTYFTRADSPIEDITPGFRHDRSSDQPVHGNLPVPGSGRSRRPLRA